MDYALKLFDQMPQRDVFAWNTLIRGYSNLGPFQEAIILYKDMHFRGFLPDNYTFPFVLRSCSVLSALREGRELHCNIIKYGFESDVFVQSSLITLYAQSRETLDSELLFEQMRFLIDEDKDLDLVKKYVSKEAELLHLQSSKDSDIKSVDTSGMSLFRAVALDRTLRI
ncbi:hypothetical protein K7X08_002228 [Anisodus acutangulus]|uniref:Pentatricopeptide repeat-containing protein n=1 Tax=Anisodus acutangulus TaxID=402998 RepID=A0A9Q1LP36_9SOLA|nr:hypothetical protein K7X08_002228 [Anisodus acutangulus]